MTLELSQKAQDVIRKVEKLLALANDPNNNEHQAAAAAAKAQEMLLAYNLDMATITGQSGRAKEFMSGGLYQWQRDLWSACAELNFCLYRTIKGTRKGQKFEHRLIGRRENVVGTRVMAEYLQQTVERFAQTEAKTRGVSCFVREMIAYREGMATRLYERLSRLRQERLAEERRQQEADRRAQPTPTGDTKHALVLASYIDDEESLNIDFQSGLEPGTTQRRRLAADIDYQKRVEQHERWKKDFPEQAAAEAERQAKANAEYWKKEERNAKRRSGRQRYRAETPAERRRNTNEFHDGYARGNEVSLSQQIGTSTTKGIK